jgi:hypothetical protein
MVMREADHRDPIAHAVGRNLTSSLAASSIVMELFTNQRRYSFSTRAAGSEG